MRKEPFACRNSFLERPILDGDACRFQLVEMSRRHGLDGVRVRCGPVCTGGSLRRRLYKPPLDRRQSMIETIAPVMDGARRLVDSAREQGIRSAELELASQNRDLHRRPRALPLFRGLPSDPTLIVLAPQGGSRLPSTPNNLTELCAV